MRDSMIADAGRKLIMAEIPPGARYHKQGAAIIAELLKKGSVSEDHFFDLAEQRGIGKKLLEANVFALHFDSRQVTFQSTLMRRCCEERTSWFEKKIRG